MKRKKGSALILVLGVVAFLLVLGVATVHATSSTSTTNTKVDNSDNLRLAAESGIERGFQYIKDNYTSIPASGNPWTVTKDNNGSIFNKLKFNVENGAFTCEIELYNYDINDTPTSTDYYKMYSIKSTAKNKTGGIKVITANVMKKVEVNTVLVPGNSKFLDILLNRTFSIAAEDNGKKDIHSTGNNLFNVNGDTYLQGIFKGNGNPFKNGHQFINITGIKEYVEPTSPTALHKPSFKSPTPAGTVVLDDNYKSTYPYIIDNNGTQYTIVLINGNLEIRTDEIDHTVIYCSGRITDPKQVGNIDVNYSFIMSDEFTLGTQNDLHFNYYKSTVQSGPGNSANKKNIRKPMNVADTKLTDSAKEKIREYISSVLDIGDTTSTTETITNSIVTDLINYKEM